MFMKKTRILIAPLLLSAVISTGVSTEVFGRTTALQTLEKENSNLHKKIAAKNAKILELKSKTNKLAKDMRKEKEDVIKKRIEQQINTTDEKIRLVKQDLKNLEKALAKNNALIKKQGGTPEPEGPEDHPEDHPEDPEGPEA